MAKRVSYLGIMTALACMMSYIELLIPLFPGIYGIKPGLANIVVLSLLYRNCPKEALAVSIVRVIIVSALFTNMAVFFYSAAGAVSSLTIMWLAKKSGFFSRIMVSIFGGIFHNVAQLFVAFLLLEQPIIWKYLPVLLISGTVTGMLTGYLSEKIKIALK